MATQLQGASVWEQELYEHLTTHEDVERQLLEEYMEAATGSASPAFQYLASLIVEDEKRHHRLFRDLASALQTDAELRPESPAVPRLDWWGPDGAGIAALTDRLLAREREDARELRQLAKSMKDVKDTTMWHLLVRLMELDTDKHIEILEFVKRHAGRPLV